MNDGMYTPYFRCNRRTVKVYLVDKSFQAFLQNVDHMLSGRPLDYNCGITLSQTTALARRTNYETSIEAKRSRQEDQGYGCQHVTWDVGQVLRGNQGRRRAMYGSHTLHSTWLLYHWPEAGYLMKSARFTVLGWCVFEILAHTMKHLCGRIRFELEGRYQHGYYTTIVGKYGTFTEKLQVRCQRSWYQEIWSASRAHHPYDFEKYINAYPTWARYESVGVLILCITLWQYQERNWNLACDFCRRWRYSYEAWTYRTGIQWMCSNRHFRYNHRNCLYNIQQWNLRQDGRSLERWSSSGSMHKKVSIIENGSWNPVSGKLIKAFFEDAGRISEFVEIS